MPIDPELPVVSLLTTREDHRDHHNAIHEYLNPGGALHAAVGVQLRLDAVTQLSAVDDPGFPGYIDQVDFGAEDFDTHGFSADQKTITIPEGHGGVYAVFQNLVATTEGGGVTPNNDYLTLGYSVLHKTDWSGTYYESYSSEVYMKAGLAPPNGYFVTVNTPYCAEFEDGDELALGFAWLGYDAGGEATATFLADMNPRLSVNALNDFMLAIVRIGDAP